MVIGFSGSPENPKICVKHQFEQNGTFDYVLNMFSFDHNVGGVSLIGTHVSK